MNCALKLEFQVVSTILTLPSEDDEAKVEHKFDSKPLFRKGEELANLALRTYLDYVRVQYDQRWLRASATVHRAIYSEVRDSYGNLVASNLPDGRGIAVGVSGDRSLMTPDKHRSILSLLESGAAIDLEEIVHADARFIGWPEKDPDYKQAILLAAIACEMKIKNVLDRLAKPEQRELLEEILKKRARPAVGLFDSGLKDICGRSLKEDNESLYLALERLFIIRNAIAHRRGIGEHVPNDDDIVDWLNCQRKASDVFQYLNDLETELGV